MIVIGHMNLTLKKGAGEFYCPTCLDQRPYTHRRTKRFITVYFIPVLPIATVGEHLRCEKCRQQFPVQALGKTKEQYEQTRRLEFANDVRRVMVVTMLADGLVQEVELAAISNTFRQLAGQEMTREQLANDVEQARRAKVDAKQFAKAVAQRRTASEREAILRGAFLVASAGGQLSPQRMEQIKSLPAALGVSEDRFREIVAQMS